MAKPNACQLQLINHHFINSHSIHENINAGFFESYALSKVNDIFLNRQVAVLVGGTGLYVKAFCEGLDAIPPADHSFRRDLLARYQTGGLPWLHEQIRINDPDLFIKNEFENPQRMMRALEVKLTTGKSILEFQSGRKAMRPFKILKIGFELPRPVLNNQIDTRVSRMMASGLLKEAEVLYQYKHLNALQTVGYRELFEHLEGKVSLDEAINKIMNNTHQYAKRQMTWFKKDTSIIWKHPGDDLQTILP